MGATDIVVGTVGEELGAAEELGMAAQELGGTLTSSEPKKKTRKRPSNSSICKANICKRLHQEGKEYNNASNTKVPAKKVRSQKNCAHPCKFKCAQKVTPTEREQFFLDYYKLTQNNEECAMKERKRTVSFKYYLNVEGERIRVRKSFYLGTLAISQKPIYNTQKQRACQNLILEGNIQYKRCDKSPTKRSRFGITSGLSLLLNPITAGLGQRGSIWNPRSMCLECMICTL